MAFSLKLTCGGSDLFTFTDGTNCYVSGERGGWISNPWVEPDGAEVANDTYRLLFVGGLSTVRTSVGKVEDALRLAAEHWQSRPHEPVYLEMKVEDADDYHRSPVHEGELVNFDIDQALRSGQMTALLTVRRENYWEGAETAAEASNTTAATTDPLPVVNHEDADVGDDFYAEIAADQITGSLPTPAILSFANTTDDANLVDHLYVGQFVASGSYNPPAATDLILEGAGTADANCSGGAYKVLSWPDASETQLATWTIDSALYRARPYRILARFRDTFAYTDLWLKVKLLAGSVVVGETRWGEMAAGLELQSIGNLQIPPYGHRAYLDLGNLTVALYAKRAAGAGTVNLDYLAAMPLDGWRKYEAMSGLAYGETLTDNPIDATLTTDDGADTTVTHTIKEGKPVMLWPGKKQVLYFLHDLTDGTAPIARTGTVQISYRPRRRTI